jgi:hypothetical protein
MKIPLLILASPSAWKNGLAEIPYNATNVSALRKEIEEKRNGTLISRENILWNVTEIAMLQTQMERKKFWTK